ncbi:MAG TPA: ribosome silencing factor [Sphingobacteriaceae bacterium]|nr:ribosome silencing factor [Sphingobacteriaceae bacterium]
MNSREQALMAGTAAAQRKARKVVILDLRALSAVSDYFVVCSGNTPVQVRAIADHIMDYMRQEADLRPLRVEGYNEGRWVLLDYGDVIVHVFHEEERDYYGLERLWGDAEVLEVDAGEPVPYN